ncbi:tyrosine-type recombinase/integrase [Neomoorella humiferrea]|uniref:tyrosine-type recombinase/integrase n=1 Tax=Neomoorella humiferrea TaxID=676965 RepID=UPI003D912CE9
MRRVINTELSLKEIKELAVLLSADDLEELMRQKGELLPNVRPESSISLGEAIRKYDVEELSHHPETTRETYTTTLRQFYQSMMDQFGYEPLLEEIKASHIRCFIDELQQGGISENTAMNKLTTIKALFKFLWRRGFIYVSPAHEIKNRAVKKSLPVALTPKEARQLIDIAGRTRNGIRDQAMIATMLYTGCRVSELVTIKVSDINFKNETIRVLGKGNKEREVPLHRDLYPYLVRYLRQYGLKDHPEEKLFNVGARRVEQLVENLKKKLGIVVPGDKNVTPHCLRHTFAVLV